MPRFIGWLTWSLLIGHGDCSIDVAFKPAFRDIPPGRVTSWAWQGPGRVQVNASCRDGERLDFYVVTGDERELRRHQEQHLPIKEQPDCGGCSQFSMDSSLPSIDSNVTVLVVSNQDGLRPVRLEYTEALLGVPSCMERCFLRPWGFIGMALMLTLLISCIFRLAQPLCRGENRPDDDEAWAPQVMQCRRPPKPREAWCSWIRHGCIMTYPWNPWYNDLLEYPLRCLVLMVSLGLTMFISTLYSHFFDWDSMSTGSWEPAEGGTPSNTSTSSASSSVPGILAVSVVSSVLESVLRMLALALFRTSLACTRLQKRWHAQAPALISAICVVVFCIAYPLALATSSHLCRFVRHLCFQFLISQVIRGLPMAVGATTVQYSLLKVWGRAVDPFERRTVADEMAELNS